MPALSASRITGAPRARVAGDFDLVPGPSVTLFTLEYDSEFIVPGEPLEILNLDDPQGHERPVEIVLYVRNEE
jgi:hypothetical protein